MNKAIAWAAAIGGAGIVVGLIGRGLGRRVVDRPESEGGPTTTFFGVDESGYVDDVLKGAFVLLGAWAVGMAVHKVMGGSPEVVG